MGAGDKLNVAPDGPSKVQQSKRLHDELLDVPLPQIISRAASGYGVDPDKISKEGSEHRRDSAFVRNEAGQKAYVQTIGGKTELKSGTQYQEWDRTKTLPFDTEHGQANLTATYNDQNVDNLYVIERSQDLTLETTALDGRKIRYKVKYLEERHGEYYGFVPRESKWIDGKEVYFDREVSPGRVVALKHLVAEQYGLKFEAPKPKSPPRKDGKYESYSPETTAYVDNLVFELRQQGMTGDGLHKKMLHLLHPDNAGEQSTEALQYYLDLDMSGL